MSIAVRVVVTGHKTVFRVERVADGYQAVSEKDGTRLGPYPDQGQATKAARDYILNAT